MLLSHGRERGRGKKQRQCCSIPPSNLTCAVVTRGAGPESAGYTARRCRNQGAGERGRAPQPRTVQPPVGAQSGSRQTRCPARRSQREAGRPAGPDRL